MLPQVAQALVHPQAIHGALQHVEKDGNISLLPGNHKRKSMRHSHATPVRDVSIPQGQGNNGDLLHCVSNKRNLKSSFHKQNLLSRLCLHEEQWELFDAHVKETQMK